MKTKPKILSIRLIARHDPEHLPIPLNPFGSGPLRFIYHHHIYCRAVVCVKGRRAVFYSQGCRGVRADDKRRPDVEREETDQLVDILASMGFGQRAIAYALKRMERVEIKEGYEDSD